MFKLKMPKTSKKYYEQILHYILRHPCTTKIGILCAIKGNCIVVLNRLDELYDKGIVELRYSEDCIGALYYINDRWLDYALRCKGDY